MKTEERPFEAERWLSSSSRQSKLPMRSEPNDSLACDRVEAAGCGATSTQLYYDHTPGPTAAAAAVGYLRGTAVEVAQIDVSTGSVIRSLCCFVVRHPDIA